MLLPLSTKGQDQESVHLPLSNLCVPLSFSCPCPWTHTHTHTHTHTPVKVIGIVILFPHVYALLKFKLYSTRDRRNPRENFSFSAHLPTCMIAFSLILITVSLSQIYSCIYNTFIFYLAVSLVMLLTMFSEKKICHVYLAIYFMTLLWYLYQNASQSMPSLLSNCKKLKI